MGTVSRARVALAASLLAIVLVVVFQAWLFIPAAILGLFTLIRTWRGRRAQRANL